VVYQKKNDIIQFCSLGSGSKGNGSLITHNDAILLLDCGFSTRETIKRLTDKGILPSQITAILVTHEHSDHIKGVASFSNKFSIPVWMSKGTSLHKASLNIKDNNILNSHSDFSLGSFNITPVLVPHDSREATQFIFKAANKKLGILTDVGSITNHIVEQYNECDALILEFNYDEEMLYQGPYPYSLKKRVSGKLGHLSNNQSIELLEKININKLQLLVVAHKSAENNSSLIIDALINKVKESKIFNYFIASQEDGFSWQEIE
jgi:phosphoribosyl 1,2-cyclic phosphodiesterase